MTNAETGEELVRFQVRNDADMPEGAEMRLTWADMESLNAQLPLGWYIEEVVR